MFGRTGGKESERSRRRRALSSMLLASKQEINSARAPNVMPAGRRAAAAQLDHRRDEKTATAVT